MRKHFRKLINTLLAVAYYIADLMFSDMITPTWPWITIMVLCFVIPIISWLPASWIRKIIPRKLQIIFLEKSERSEVFDVEPWRNVHLFKLGVAACLWFEIDPENPITDNRAQAKLEELIAAIELGHLKRHVRGFEALGKVITNTAPPPEYNTNVTSIDLRNYAESIGDVPRFLEDVRMPN